MCQFVHRCILAVVVASLLLRPSASCLADLSEQELKEIRRIEESLENGSLPQPPGWTFNHGASDEGEKELKRIGYPTSTGELETVVRNAGGWGKYKAGVASLLKSKDLVVRGFMAIWLADLGDRAYAKDLLALLRTQNVPGADDFFPNWDRGRAACALGVINARDHVKELAECLRHSSPEIRAGAAEGLGWMQSKQHHKEIAALLEDDDSTVVWSAIWALAKLGAKQYANRFAEMAASDGSGVHDGEAALRALAVMRAKEQAPKIAKLLEDKEHSLKRGQAIMCLALMDCREYAKDFAALTEDPDVFIRTDAIVALGIMGETQYAPKISSLLRADDNLVQQAAAWSLIIMESKEYAAAAIAVYESLQLSGSGIPSHVSEDDARRLKKRFQESLASSF